MVKLRVDWIVTFCYSLRCFPRVLPWVLFVEPYRLLGDSQYFGPDFVQELPDRNLAPSPDTVEKIKTYISTYRERKGYLVDDMEEHEVE